LLFLHESGHFIATRAIGGQATMRISNRLFFIVAETISYHLAVLPKELRYFVYFGGMFVDFFVIASIYWIFIIADHLGIQLGLLRSFCLIIVLINIKGIVWQYNAFLQTDMYNFLSDFLNQENLQADSKKFLVRKISHWKSPVSIPFRRIMLSTILSKDAISNADDLRMFTKRDRTEFGIYGTILITGVIFLALQFLLYTLPKDITFFIGSGQNIFTGIQNHNILKVLEGILLLILISHPYLLLLYMRIRGKKK
jgi:hypothetical protein